MKYILITDLDGAEEFDDGLYAIKTRLTPDDTSEPTRELFSDGDIFKIKKKLPQGADAMALKDDWVFWNQRTGEFMSYAFRD